VVSGIDNQKILLRRLDLRGRVAALFRMIDLLVVPVRPFAPLTLATIQTLGEQPDLIAKLQRYTCPFRHDRSSNHAAARRFQRDRIADRIPARCRPSRRGDAGPRWRGVSGRHVLASPPACSDIGGYLNNAKREHLQAGLRAIECRQLSSAAAVPGPGKSAESATNYPLPIHLLELANFERPSVLCVPSDGLFVSAGNILGCLQGDRLLPRLGHQADDLFGFCPIGVVGEDRVDTALGEAQLGVAPRPRLRPAIKATFLT
jgi:hypothetical protein